MTLKNYIKTANNGLTTHKSRSFLTILGIVIGITAIMMIMSMGKGAEGLILSELQGMGADTVVIRPGKEPTGPSDVAGTLFADSIGQREVEALQRKQNVPDIVEVAPGVIVPESVSHEGETYTPTILGWSAEFMGEALNLYAERGFLHGDTEARQNAAVAVIGQKVAEELFGEEDPLGQNITIKGKRFRVTGILPDRGQVAFFNVNDLVLIPHTTAQKYLLGINHYHEVITKVTSPDVVERAVRDIETTLRELHNIEDPEDDDFFVVTQQGAIEQIGTILNTFTIFLSSVVAIALVVGGIGVMNIMLVSVTERTREIGLRKAVGATENNILVQFLIEAVILTGTGGIIGVLLGSLLSFAASVAIERYADLAWSFSFPITAAIIGVVASGVVGLAFGIYPAKQAARKDPIDALRYE